MSSPGTFDWSTPGVRAHEAVAGHAHEHAALGAQQLGRLVEHDLHERAGPCRARRASARARSPGSTSARRRSRPSAFDTTLWATTSTSPSARSARGRRRQQRAEVVARARPRAAAASGMAERLRPSPASGRRARRAWRGAARRAARCERLHAARPRSSPVSTSSTSDGGALHAQAAPAASAAARWRSKLPGPKLGSIASGRRRAAARWCRCRGGRARSSRRRRRRRVEQRRRPRAGSSSGVSPGTSSTRSKPARQRVPDADQRGRATGPPRSVSSQHLGARAERGRRARAGRR